MPGFGESNLFFVFHRCSHSMLIGEWVVNKTDSNVNLFGFCPILSILKKEFTFYVLTEKNPTYQTPVKPPLAYEVENYHYLWSSFSILHLFYSLFLFRNNKYSKFGPYLSLDFLYNFTKYVHIFKVCKVGILPYMFFSCSLL